MPILQMGEMSLKKVKELPMSEKAMATHSSTLAWKIPWTEEPGRLQSMGSLGVGDDFTFTFTFHFHALEKEMTTHSSILAWRISGTGGAWWAAIYGVAQSQTRLKRLSSSNSSSSSSSSRRYPKSIYWAGYGWSDVTTFLAKIF